MIELDGIDLEILQSMYMDAPCTGELRGIAHDAMKRAYRMSRHRLCRGDSAGMHPGQPRCWSMPPTGERVVELTSRDNTSCRNYRCCYTRPPSEQELDHILEKFGDGYCKFGDRCWSEYCKNIQRQL